jgi:nifR3 family TIM-barrel protein
METQNFWKSFNGPIWALAPMEDVTDTVFRQVIMSCGRPSVMFTEFTNCEGMQSAGQKAVIHRLKYSNSEQPLIAQVWGITPDDYFKTAKLIKEMGFAGIDINMGCPVPKIIKQGACSALINNQPLAFEILKSVREAVGPNFPVSVKTRIGFSKIQTEDWLGFLLVQPINAIIIHARTVKELSEPKPHWEEVKKIVQLRSLLFLNPEKAPAIIGNGSVLSIKEGEEIIKETGVDGIMFGRGIFQNPWLFNPNYEIVDDQLINTQLNQKVSVVQRLELMQYHLNLWEETWGSQKPVAVLKKYFKIYIHGFEGASQMRSEVMNLSSLGEIKVWLNQKINIHLTENT